MKRIAFDLDETLGTPVIADGRLVGWQTRPGAERLLATLARRRTLLLWSVGGRQYVERALAFGLAPWFGEIYSWDELPTRWKDVRAVDADLLVDDSPHHRESAEKFGLQSRYLVVPA